MKPTNIKPDLSPQQINEFQKELDQLRYSIESKLGQDDVDYIKGMIDVQRYLEISGRLLIHFSLDPVSWSLGVASLSAAHILENMEIGHNVMHGQYDFMNDPKINSAEYDWTISGTAKNWKRAHNFHHHTFTNIVGKDHDYGYGMFRFADDVKWKPVHLIQPVFSPLTGLFFEFAVAVADLQIPQHILPKWFKPDEHDELMSKKELMQELKEFITKSTKKGLKEYVMYPLLAGPLAPKVLAGNVSAQLIRNVWSYAVIYCGHLPEGIFSFTEEEAEAETKGQWYIRQILGSGNFEGSPLLHIMSGHLSHQIEHHLFPDIPARHYPEMGPKVQELCAKYDIPYQTGKMVPQLMSVAKRLVKYSVPDKKSWLSRKVKSSKLNALIEKAIAPLPTTTADIKEFSSERFTKLTTKAATMINELNAA